MLLFKYENTINLPYTINTHFIKKIKLNTTFAQPGP